MVSRIIGIHPIDGDLRFLKRMLRLLAGELENKFKYLRLSNNQRSHIECLISIKQAKPQDTLIFLCHGRSSGILGCSFRTQVSICPNRYEHGELISIGNFDTLKDKKILCMACDSNKFAKEVVDEGSRVFVGFDNIYFDSKEYLDTESWGKKVAAITKYHLRTCVFSAILNAWKNDLTYAQCVYNLKLMINKTNDSLIMNYKKHRGRKFYCRAADSLQLIKEGIRIWGNGDLSFWE